MASDIWLKSGTSSLVWDGTNIKVCSACPCSGVSICAGCCPSQVLPSTLTATITDAGGCACLAGTYNAIWDGIGWRLQATLCGGNTIDMLLWCTGGSTCAGFALYDTHFVPGESAPAPNCGVGSTFTNSSCNCATFQVTFNAVGVSGPCCTGAKLINIVFTGTPVVGPECPGCCPVAIPATSHVTFADTGGNCACLNGVSVPVTFTAMLPGWTGSVTACGHTIAVTLIACTGPDPCDPFTGWQIIVQCSGATLISSTRPTTCACKTTLDLVWNITLAHTCGTCLSGDTITATLTA